MTPKHEYFELLCMLAELGQLSTSELSEFREHSRSCADCQQRLPELVQLHATMLVTNAFEHPLPQPPRGMTKRFAARATREGIPLSEQAPTKGHVNLILAGATLTVLLVAGRLLDRNRIAHSPAPAEFANSAHSIPFNPVAESRGPEVAGSKPSRSAEFRQPQMVRQPRRQDFLARSSTGRLSQSTLGEKAGSQGSTITAASDAPHPTLLRGDVLAAELNLGPVDSFSPAPKSSRFRYSITRENTAKEPDLLTACMCSPPEPLRFRGNFALASSASFSSSDADGYSTALKPEFKPNPATFQLIENVRQ